MNKVSMLRGILYLGMYNSVLSKVGNTSGWRNLWEVSGSLRPPPSTPTLCEEDVLCQGGGILILQVANFPSTNYNTIEY